MLLEIFLFFAHGNNIGLFGCPSRLFLLMNVCFAFHVDVMFLSELQYALALARLAVQYSVVQYSDCSARFEQVLIAQSFKAVWALFVSDCSSRGGQVEAHDTKGEGSKAQVSTDSTELDSYTVTLRRIFSRLLFCIAHAH